MARSEEALLQWEAIVTQSTTDITKRALGFVLTCRAICPLHFSGDCQISGVLQVLIGQCSEVVYSMVIMQGIVMNTSDSVTVASLQCSHL